MEKNGVGRVFRSSPACLVVWAAADRGVLVQKRRTALVIGNGAEGNPAFL